MAAITAAVTGCRPAELVSGVQLSIEGTMLVALVRGAKVDEARGKGQDWRRLEWSLDHPSSLVRDLAAEVLQAGGSLKATVASASNFSKSMSNAAAREWPKRKTTVPPYCFRHQVAGDMKADGQLGQRRDLGRPGPPERRHEIDLRPREHVQGPRRGTARVTAARQVKAKAAVKMK